MKLANASKRAVALSLSALLCVSMVPFVGCAQGDQAGSDAGAKSKPTCAAEDPKGSANAQTIGYDPAGYLKPDEKWATYDDGSFALDIVQTHVYANATKQNITVKLEGGATLVPEIALEDVTLTGALSAWKVVSVDRVSDTELSITAERDESVEAAAGASVAGVALAESCMQLPQADMSEMDAHMEKMIAEGNGEELAEDVEASEPVSGVVEQSVAQKGFFSKLVPPAFADEVEEADASPYEATVPYVHPSMVVDVEDTEIKDGKTVYRIVASEFSFPEGISAEDFSIELASTAPEGATAPEIKEVTRLGDFEVEVVVDDDASKDDSLCSYASLHLSERGSGTGGEVTCALELPDAWINARIVQVNEKPVDQAADEAAGAEAGSEEGSDSGEVDTITLNTTVHNAEDNPDSLNVSVLCADGTYREVGDVSVEAAENGGSDITVDADKLSELAATDENGEPAADDAETAANIELAKEAAEDGYSILSVDTDDVDLAYGGASNPDPVLLCVPLISNSLDLLLSPATNFVEGAEGILGELASMAWDYARSEWFADAPLIGERTNNQLYYNILKLQSDLSNMASKLDTLGDKEAAHYNANIVNTANAKIARIQSEYTLLSGLFNQVAAAKGDQAATEAAIDRLMAAKKNVVDNMIVDMGELYSTLKVADASTGTSLVGVYDNMAALSSNWGVTAVLGGQSYRNTIADVWAGCTTMLYVICGGENFKDEYGVSMTNLQSMTAGVDSLLSSNSIKYNDVVWPVTAKDLAGGNTYVKPSEYAYYNNTTHEWYTFCFGYTSSTGWNNAFFKTKKHGRFRDYTASCPFISWKNNELTPAWGSLYLTTEQAKAMSARLGPKGNIVDEIEEFAEDGVANYLITGARFDMGSGDGCHNRNNWHFDTYEFGKEFTQDKLHFEGDVEQAPFSRAKKTVKSSTKPADMMVLARVNIS